MANTIIDDLDAVFNLGLHPEDRKTVLRMVLEKHQVYRYVPHWLVLAREGKMIDAIKAVRELSRDARGDCCGLVMAKNIVENSI